MTLFEKWWDHGTKTFCIQWCPRHTLRCFLCFHNNGAKKGRDRCYDGSLWILGFCFNYTNWRYDQ